MEHGGMNELKEIIKMAKKAGLKRLKTGDVELEFHDAKPQPMQPDVSDIPNDGKRMPSDADMLFYSTDFFDDTDKKVQDDEE